MENLDRLLVRGCNWLKNYLIVNPQMLAKLSTCQTADLIPFFFIRGRYPTPLSFSGRGVRGEGN